MRAARAVDVDRSRAEHDYQVSLLVDGGIALGRTPCAPRPRDDDAAPCGSPCRRISIRTHEFDSDLLDQLAAASARAVRLDRRLPVHRQRAAARRRSRVSRAPRASCAPRRRCARASTRWACARSTTTTSSATTGTRCWAAQRGDRVTPRRCRCGTSSSRCAARPATSATARGGGARTSSASCSTAGGFAARTPRPTMPSKTMLGEAQHAWLVDGGAAHRPRRSS